MNDNLVIKSGTFNLVYKDKGGSLRKAAPGTPFSAGASGSISIAHQPYVDSATKKSGRRSVLRFQLEKSNAAGEANIAYAQLIVGRPDDSVTVPDSDILALVDCIRQYIAGTAADGLALNLASEFAVTGLQ